MLLLAAHSSAQETLPSGVKQLPQTSPQTERLLGSYEGQVISHVEFAGHPGLNTTNLQSLVALRPGAAFSRAKVEQTVAALKSDGRFAGVQLNVVPDLNGLRVLLVLQPAMYFGIYRFPGATQRFPYTRLLQISNYPPAGPYTEADVTGTTEALTRFFQRSGYFHAEVSPVLQLDSQHGIVNVDFNTQLGVRAKFGKVAINGASPAETKRMLQQLRSLSARLRGAAIRHGKPYSLKTLQNATQFLENSLIKRHYLAAKVTLIGAEYEPATNLADISFDVDQGTLTKVEVQGAHLWSWTRRRLLPIYQKMGVDEDLVQEGRQNLVSHFQSKGFFDAQVNVDTRQQANSTTIIYRITRGGRHKVTAVEVTGNTSLDEDEVRSQLAVRKARTFSHGKFSQKLVRTSARDLESLYHAAGFSSVKITPLVRRANGNVEVTFKVDEGQRDIVEELKIVGNTTTPAADIAPLGLKVTPGQPYSQKLVNDDRNQITAHYLDRGFLTATFRETVSTVPGDPHRVIVTYFIYEGPRVITSSTLTLGRAHTRQRFIDHQVVVKPKRPLTDRAMLTSETQLYTPGIFDWAEISTRRQVTTQTEEDVMVRVHEGKRNSITYGFGFEVVNRGGNVPNGTVAVPGLPPVGVSSNFVTSEKTFWGPRGSIEYSRRNLRGKAETFTIGGLAGRLDQRAAIGYQDPTFRYSSWATSLSLSGEHNTQNPIFTSLQVQAGYQFQRPLNAKRTRNVFLRYSFTITNITDLLIPELVPPQDRHVRLSTLSATYTNDTRDDPIDAHRGNYQSYEIAFNPTFLGSNVNFARILGQFAQYRKIPGNIIWANSIRLGIEGSFFNSFVPLSEEFFSGGGSTLRGFPLNGAGPQRPVQACGNPAVPSTCSLITVPVGGNQLFIVNTELRIPTPIKNFGVVGFYDGGNVFPSVGFHGQYTNSVGGGFRYKTPVGPIRVDIGHNLNAPPGIKSTQVFVTLGQAF